MAATRRGRRPGARVGLTASGLPLRHALLLGALQGPAELLPVSSSGHLALVPRLLGWPVADLDPATRKTLEVALHAGSSGALALLALRGGASSSPADASPPAASDSSGECSCSRRRPTTSARERALAAAREAFLLGLTFVPPAVAGLALERQIEGRLGGIRAVAVAQVGAGIAMWLADRRPAVRSRPDAADHLAVGVAQAAALIPGVSRSGAAVTAGRLRGLDRPAAIRLSFRAALPVTLGAAALKGVRALQGELDPSLRAPLAAGAAAAFATGVAAIPLVARLERAHSLAPLAAYRVALGAAALVRTR